MRKILLSTVALLMAVSMMAIGNNSGTSKANAIDFDWANGNVHEAADALWYRVDLSSLEGTADPTLALYLTNLTDQSTAVDVDVVASVTILGQTETMTESFHHTIAAKDHKPWSMNVTELLEFNVKHIFLTLKSDKKIALAAKIYETEDIVDDACTNAVDFNWAGQNVAAGEKWFRLNIAEVDASKKLDFVVENKGTQVANVNFDLSLDCPASIVMGYNWVIPVGGNMTEEFGRLFLDQLKEDYIYLKLTSDQDLKLSVKEVVAPTPTPSFDPSAAPQLVIGEKIVVNGETMYKINLADLKAPLGYETVCRIANPNSVDVTLEQEIAFSLPVKNTIVKTLVVPAEATIVKDVVNNLTNAINSDVAYLRLQADKQLNLWIEYVKNESAVLPPVSAPACENSIQFDWNSTLTQKAFRTKWYEFNVSSLKQNQEQVQLTFTNKSDSMVVVVGSILLDCNSTDSIPYALPIPAGKSISQLINYNLIAAAPVERIYVSATVIPTSIDALSDITSVSSKEDIKNLLSLNIDAEVELTATKSSALVDPTLCNTNETLQYGVKYTQAAGTTKWYRVTEDFIKNDLGLLASLTIENQGSKAANVTLGATIACDYGVVSRATVTIPTWFDLTSIIPSGAYYLIDKLTNKEITEFYIEVTTDQPIMFGFGVEYGNAFGCDDATVFDWATGTTIPANDAKWYKFDVTDLKANEEQVKLTFTNTADSIAWVAAFLTHECPFYVGLPMVFPVPAGVSVDKWIDYSFIASTPINTVYMAVYTDSNIEIKAEKETAKITPVTGCLDATLVEPNVQYTITPGTSWYKFSATPFINATGKSATLSFANKSGKTAHVTTGATVGCEYGILTRGKLPVPQMDVDITVPLWVFGVMKQFVDDRVDQYYVEVTTDEPIDFQIAVEMPEDSIPGDTLTFVYDTINMYACAGSDFVHPVTGVTTFLPEDSVLITVDTLHTANILVDSVVTTIVSPYVAPQALDSAALVSIIGAYPELTPGAKPTLPTDEILAYYASVDEDSIADVVAAEWLSAKVACGATSHKVFLSVETSCQSSYTWEFVMPVKTPEVIQQETTICFGEKVVWNSEEFSTTGTHTASLKNVYGCDSVVYELKLTVLPAVQNLPVEKKTICHGESYPWNGQTCNESKTYTHVVKNSLGCDSLIYTLELTVLPAVQNLPAEKKTICHGDSYPWNGQDCNESKTYTHVVKNSLGCDSLIYTLELTVMAAVELPATANVQELILVLCGKTANVAEAEAYVKAYVEAVELTPAIESIVWEQKVDGQWVSLQPTDGTDDTVVVRYTLNTACEDVTSDEMTITVEKPTYENDPDMDNIVPIYSKYGNRLLTVDLVYIKENYDWDVVADDVTWYNGDQVVGTGFYLTKEDGTPLPAGKYYARIDHTRINPEACDGTIQTQSVTVEEANKAPKLMPTVARPQELIRVLNLNADAVSTISIYSTTGDLISTFQVANQEETTFPAAELTGYYVVDVQTETEKVSLRYVVK